MIEYLTKQKGNDHAITNLPGLGKRRKGRSGSQGRIEKARDAICRYLNRRFGAPSSDLQRVVQKISDQETLDNLMEELFALNTLDEARKIVRASS
ncbi:MAG: DUF4351 domain-containing protein [Bacillota bacterium]